MYINLDANQFYSPSNPPKPFKSGNPVLSASLPTHTDHFSSAHSTSKLVQTHSAPSAPPQSTIHSLPARPPSTVASCTLSKAGYESQRRTPAVLLNDFDMALKKTEVVEVLDATRRDLTDGIISPGGVDAEDSCHRANNERLDFRGRLVPFSFYAVERSRTDSNTNYSRFCQYREGWRP